MVTIVFKILLIILIPAPVIAAAVYFYVQMLGFIGERNRAEKRRIQEGGLKGGRNVRSTKGTKKAKNRKNSGSDDDRDAGTDNSSGRNRKRR